MHLQYTCLGFLYSHQATEDEKMSEKEYDIPRVGLPRLIAYRPEPKQIAQKVPLTSASVSIISHSAGK